MIPIIIRRKTIRYEIQELEQIAERCTDNATIFIDGKISIYKKLLKEEK
jgi:hypothetical protein